MNHLADTLQVFLGKCDIPDKIRFPKAELGRWFEMVGEERRAAALYGQARATIEHMLAAVENPAWQASLRQSGPVQTILACAARVSS